MSHYDSDIAQPKEKSLDLGSLTKTIPTINLDMADGQEFMWGADFHLIIDAMSKKYGAIYCIETGKTPVVVLNGYSLVREALITQNDVFNVRADFDILNIAPQKHFLELEAGEAWSLHRKTFATAMRDYFSERWDAIEGWMTTEINDLVDVWTEQGEIAFDPNREVSLKLASFLHKVMFDERFGDMEKSVYDEKSLSWLPSGFINSTRYELMPESDKVRYYEQYGDVIEKFSSNLNGLDAYVTMNVQKHQADYQADEYRDLCDYLIAASNGIPEEVKTRVGVSDREVIIGSLTQVAGAGGGVGAFVMRWALLYLASFPDQQKKVQEELDRVVGRSNTPLQQHKADLHYTQAFISEVLRHCSITAMPAANYAASKDTVIDGYFIEQGTPLIINNYSVTRDENLWDSPEEFMPERFLEADGSLSKKQQGKTFPFGIGQRRCLGELLGKFIIHTLFTQLVHRFEYSLPEGESMNLKAISGVFLVPEKVSIVAKPRT